MIHNEVFTVKKTDVVDLKLLPELIKERGGHNILRWFVAKVEPETITIEATISDVELPEWEKQTVDEVFPGKTAAINLIPTGVGCDIGGYAGDAAPATALLGSCVDYLITNPNAVNASNFIFMDQNIVYTEGYCIDAFSRGALNLYLPHFNKVGLIIEKSSDAHLDTVFNVLNTARAVFGVDVAEYVITDEPIGGRCVQHPSGSYVGTIDNPDVLFAACEKLLARGVNAIGVTSHIQDLPPDNYAKHFSGQHPNPLGGAEAVISHLITRKYGVPSAHAPLINIKQLDLEDRVVDARGAGEMVSESGLACVLIGLRKAPQIMRAPSYRVADVINIHNVLALITPATCLGGVPMLYAQQWNIPIIAVHNNNTILNVSQAQFPLNNVIEVHSYAEAAGILMALKRGLSLDSIIRPLATTRYSHTSEHHMVDLEDTSMRVLQSTTSK